MHGRYYFSFEIIHASHSENVKKCPNAMEQWLIQNRLNQSFLDNDMMPKTPNEVKCRMAKLNMIFKCCKIYLIKIS